MPLANIFKSARPFHYSARAPSVVANAGEALMPRVFAQTIDPR